MFDNFANENPIPHHTLDLLRQRPLDVIVIFRLSRQIDVDARTLAREHLGSQRPFTQIDRRAIDLVEHDGRQSPKDLHFKLGALDHVDRADKRINDERALRAVIEGDGVGFSDDPDGRLGAA